MTAPHRYSYGWPHAVGLIVVGLLIWFLIAPLFTPALLATIIMVIGILITVFGVIGLLRALL